MKRKVLNNLAKQSICASIICASLCGVVTTQEIQAAVNTTPIITQLAKELDKTEGTNEQIPVDKDVKVQHDVLLFVNGNQIPTPNGIINYKDSTFIPIALVGDALGAKVGWDGDLKIAQVELNGTTVEILNRTDVGIVTKGGNSTEKKITVEDPNTHKIESLPALNVNSSTYLPLRYVSDNLGLKINWFESHPETGMKTITIGKEDGLNYNKKPEAPKGDEASQLLAKINKGKLPTAPDGKDYNTLYGKYFNGMYDAGFGEEIKTPGGSVTINDNQDWNKLFSTDNKLDGKSPVVGLFWSDVQGMNPVYDINGDGKLGDTPLNQLSSLTAKGMAEVSKAYSIECMNFNGGGVSPYIISKYSD